MMDKVAVVQGLQAEVSELMIAFRLECLAELHQVELEQFLVEQLEFSSFTNVVAEIIALAF